MDIETWKDVILTKSKQIWNVLYDVWVYGIFGIDVSRIITATGILLVFLIIRRLLINFIINQIENFVSSDHDELDKKFAKALEDPVKLFPLAIGTFFAFEYLKLGGIIGNLIDNSIKTFLIVILFWAFYNLVAPLESLIIRFAGYITKSLRDWLSKFLRLIILCLGMATTLETWGINVGALLAGLGLVGVAVALGAQDLFKNLISGLLILAEKRFNIGDWILVEGIVEGTVESIGFRSTVVRRFDKAPVYVPNLNLSDTAVTNYTAMSHRRILWKIGVRYSSTIEQLKEIRDKIENYILENDEFAKPDEVPTFVRIDCFTESSIDILLYCYTRSTKWGEWLISKEKLALEIKNIVESAGTYFAFPSRSLYLKTDAGEKVEIFVPPGTSKNFSTEQ